jgi:hypothetical protein
MYMPSEIVRQPAFARRLLTAAVAACCVALAGAATASAATIPAAAASGAAASRQVHATDLSKLSITSASNGFSLDDQNGTPGAGSIIVTDSAPGYDESWNIGTPASDSSFTIVNATTGECIDAGLPLRQQPCDGRTTENWYFQPVTGSAQNAFMIRQEGTDNCLDLWYAAPYSDAWTDSYSCNGTAAQQWTLPASAYQAALTLAVDHAGTECASDSSTCSWTTASQSTPILLPKQCVSSVWYNATSAPVTWAFSITNTTGWSSTTGETLASEIDAGSNNVLQTKITVTVTGSVTNNLSQALGNTVTMPVPAGDYGWVSLSELATTVTGTWTFDTQGFPWTATDTITVPLTTDAAGGASVYVANTGSTFTSCSA